MLITLSGPGLPFISDPSSFLEEQLLIAKELSVLLLNVKALHWMIETLEPPNVLESSEGTLFSVRVISHFELKPIRNLLCKLRRGHSTIYFRKFIRTRQGVDNLF